MKDNPKQMFLSFLNPRSWTLPYRMFSTSPPAHPPKPSNQVLYAFRYDAKDRTVYKIGKTGNIKQRLRTYRTVVPNGVLFHVVTCYDMHMAEKILHGALKMHGYHIDKEVFHGPPSTIKELMNLVEELDRVFKEKGAKPRELILVTSALKSL